MDLLTSRVLSFIRSPDPDGFEPLALEVFRFQSKANPSYRSILAGRGVRPDQVTTWRDIPPAPADAFKEPDFAAFDPATAVRVFETSGTTLGRPGRHFLPTLDLYEASLLAGFGEHLLPDGGAPGAVVLLPPPRLAPRSSLVHMVDVACRALCSSIDWCLDELGVGLDRVRAALDRLDGPCLLAGTTLSFSALLDALGERTLLLPPGSRAMLTGGWKGTRRRWTRSEMLAAVESRLGLDPERVVEEYGMTEMGSQYYDTVLGDSLAGRVRPRALGGPPWARFRVLEPETLEELPPGRDGLLSHLDLTNVGSAISLLTGDWGRATEDGRLILHGRAPGAEPRGCSLMVEEFLGGAGRARAGRTGRCPSRDAVGAAIGRVLTDWTAHDHPDRRRIRAGAPRFTGLSVPMTDLAIEEAVGTIAAGLDDVETPAGLEGLRIGLIGAGVVPVASLAPTVLCLLSGAMVLAKPPGRDPVTLPAFAAALARTDPAVADRLAVRWWRGGDEGAEREMASSCDLLLAYGSDETIARIASRIAPDRLVAHVHRVSVAIVRAGDEPESMYELAGALGRDASLYDQQGCLSPQAVYALGDVEAADSLAEALGRAFADVQERLPLGRPDPDEASRRHQDLGRALALEATGRTRVKADRAGRWIVVRDLETAFEPSPLGRFLRVHPIRGQQEAIAGLGAHAGRVLGVACTPGLESAAPPSATWIALPGELQRPPLAWHLAHMGVTGH